MKILALEASTTSAKAMLYDVRNHVSETVSHVYDEDYSRFDRVNQAEETYRQMLRAGREVLERWDGLHPGEDAASSIEVIALIGVWHSLFLLDRSLQPASPVFHWSHTGAAGVCAEIRRDAARTRAYYQRSGCMVNAIYPFFKIEMLRRMGLPVDACYLMSQGAYNTFRMTGQRKSTRCLASGDGTLDIHTREYNWDGLGEMGVKPWQFSELIESTVAFPLVEEAARALGVRSGIPVLPTNSDGGCNQIGAGAARRGVMTFSVGTSGALRLSTDEALIPREPSTWCYLSPRGYLSGAATNGCCICTDWARNRLFSPGTSYQAIEEGVSDPVNTPVFLPFLTGERCPGWHDDRMGGFHGVRAEHNASDLYLAVQEGVLFNLYQCYRSLISVHPAPHEIMLSGGILKSPRWTQMCADIFGVDMSVTNVDQGSLLGGVVLGLEAAGALTDVTEYRPQVVRVVRPDAGAHALYQKKFRRYLACYESDRMFEAN